MDHQYSTRGDDGLARTSVESLIGELESGMRARGGNHMNITGMNLAIVKTLMNHMSKLQDRIETLEGQIQNSEPQVKRNPEYEKEDQEDVVYVDKSPVKKAKAFPAAGAEHEEPNPKSDLARYEQLKAELQKLYGGRAHEYDPTAGGHMFPPHGMCGADVTLKMIDAFQSKIKKVEQEIARLEQELGKYPYTAITPHPMIVLQPGIPNINNDRFQTARNIEIRQQLFRELAKQEGEHRILQEDLNFWSHVKLASVDYMQQIQRMFVEKDQIRARLWGVHGIRTGPW
jgi:chaperonin cofactor prefoldin